MRSRSWVSAAVSSWRPTNPWYRRSTDCGVFRLYAVSRPARSGPLVTRLGYRQACRHMRRLAEAELELREHQRLVNRSAKVAEAVSS